MLRQLAPARSFHRIRRIEQAGLLYLQANLDVCGLDFDICQC